MARAPAMAEIEALPESDRIEGLPHPRETRMLFGHGDAERTLAEALQHGRIHHAWLIAGPRGIGKATLAYRFAKAALATGEGFAPDGRSLDVAADAPASRQVRALSHPGLLVLRRPYDEKAKRFATSIPIDEVRRLRAFLGHRAAGDQRRVVIVDEANELNPNAANALLKSLEEPPARTVFLLLSSAPGRLLPTIRSRCRVLALQPLQQEELRAAVGQALETVGEGQPDAADWSAWQRIAEGSAGRFLELWHSGGSELNERVEKLIAALPKVDWRAVHALADEISPSAAGAGFELFFELLLSNLGRLVRTQATGRGEPGEVELAGRVIGPGRLASFAALWERVGRELEEALALNLDRKSLILQTVASLAAAAQDRKPA